MTIRNIMGIIIRETLREFPDYKPENDKGLVGKAVEVAVKIYADKSDPWVISGRGVTDLRIHTRNVEVKTGSGTLGPVDKQLCKGSGLVLYIPVVLLDYPLEMQQGYVMEREEFLAALGDVPGALKVNSKRGTVQIQTFWNVGENRPHGRLLMKMEASFEAHGAMDLQDFLQTI